MGYRVKVTKFFNGERQEDRHQDAPDRESAVQWQALYVANYAANQPGPVTVTRLGDEYGVHHTDSHGGEWVMYAAVVDMAGQGVALSIEMHDINSDKYGVIHAAGCRDLLDGMPIGEAVTVEDAYRVADDATCWDNCAEGVAYPMAPCARKRLAQ